MAFALEDFYSGSLNDPRYVRWTARYITAHEDGTFQTDFIPLYPCTEAEAAKLKLHDKTIIKKVEKM